MRRFNVASGVSVVALAMAVCLCVSHHGRADLVGYGSFGGWIQTSQTHQIDPQTNTTTHGNSGQRCASGARYSGGHGVPTAPGARCATGH